MFFHKHKKVQFNSIALLSTTAMSVLHQLFNCSPDMLFFQRKSISFAQDTFKMLFNATLAYRQMQDNADAQSTGFELAARYLQFGNMIHFANSILQKECTIYSG
jgi:hypothetical protein